MIFCPLKILLNSAILQFKKNRQEFIRIFQKRKSIKKGLKINVGPKGYKKCSQYVILYQKCWNLAFCAIG